MSQQGMAYNAGVAAPFATAARWLKAWVAIGTLVILVVIGYLLAIVSSLRSIDGNLAITNPDVADIRGDVDPLPNHISVINKTLVAIDTTLKPIPGTATSIINTLGAINKKFDSIDPTLKSISGGLVTALNGLVSIEGTLVDLDTNGSDGKGLQPIASTVVAINGNVGSGLIGAEHDLSIINVDLNRNTGVAAHVRNICHVLPGSPCGS
jgi:hypothetical protein